MCLRSGPPVQKIVQKKVLSESDAKDIIKEIKAESGKPEKEVREVSQTESKNAANKESGFEIPAWVNKIKPYGDLRLRHDTQWQKKVNLASITILDKNHMHKGSHTMQSSKSVQ